MPHARELRALDLRALDPHAREQLVRGDESLGPSSLVAGEVTGGQQSSDPVAYASWQGPCSVSGGLGTAQLSVGEETRS